MTPSTTQRAAPTPLLAALLGLLGLLGLVAAPAQAEPLGLSIQIPAGSLSGRASAPPITVSFVHTDGSVDAAQTGFVHLSVGANPTGSSLHGVTSLAAEQGVASFTGLTLDRTGDGYTLVAWAHGVPDASSAAFSFTAPPDAREPLGYGCSAGARGGAWLALVALAFLWRKRARALAGPLLLALGLSLGACTGGDPGGVSYLPGEVAYDAGGVSLPPITDFITGVKTTDGLLEATLVDAPPLVTHNTSPVLDVLTTPFSIPGGSKVARLTSASAPYSRLVVKVEGATGYYELRGLPLGSTQAVFFTISQSAPPAFTLAVAASPEPVLDWCPACDLGPYLQLPVSLTAVGTGPVQVSVAWDAYTDVDLHLIEPSGFEIFYARLRDPDTGGRLDLDSNPACAIDRKNNENITFAGGSPPHGNYVVNVHYFAACGRSETNYVVVVNVSGQGSKSFVGTLTGLGNDEGHEVARFTY